MTSPLSNGKRLSEAFDIQRLEYVLIESSFESPLLIFRLTVARQGNKKKIFIAVILANSLGDFIT